MTKKVKTIVVIVLLGLMVLSMAASAFFLLKPAKCDACNSKIWGEHYTQKDIFNEEYAMCKDCFEHEAKLSGFSVSDYVKIRHSTKENGSMVLAIIVLVAEFVVLGGGAVVMLVIPSKPEEYTSHKTVTAYNTAVNPTPTYTKPAAPAPTYTKSAAPAPTYAQPAAPAPTYAQPAAPAPTYAQPVASAPTYAQPVATPIPSYTPPTSSGEYDAYNKTVKINSVPDTTPTPTPVVPPVITSGAASTPDPFHKTPTKRAGDSTWFDAAGDL